MILQALPNTPAPKVRLSALTQLLDFASDRHMSEMRNMLWAVLELRKDSSRHREVDNTLVKAGARGEAIPVRRNAETGEMETEEEAGGKGKHKWGSWNRRTGLRGAQCEGSSICLGALRSA